MKGRKTEIYLATGAGIIVMLAGGAIWIRSHAFQAASKNKVPPLISNSELAQKAPTRSAIEPRDSPEKPRTVGEAIAAVTAPTQVEVDDFLLQHGRTESNLIAANVLMPDAGYLEEALKLFPGSPAILVTALTQELPPENAIELAETLAFLEPDNALNHYLHGEALLAGGDVDTAMVALSNGASSSSFETTVSQQVEGLTAFHEFRGASPDVALIQSSYSDVSKLGCVSFIYLQKMRELADALTTFDSQDERVVSVGVALGNHLSQGENSHSLLDQLVGIHIEKQFLESQAPETFNLFLNQTHGELLRDIEKQSNHLKKIIKDVGIDMNKMTTEEGVNYIKITMEKGEEAAIKKIFAK